MEVKCAPLSGRLRLLLFFLFTLLTHLGYAADWFVSTTGTDAPANGSAAAPFKTIGYAVSRAAAGDVIRIGAGTFTEQVQVAKNLTLIGQGATQTIIKAPTVLTKSFTTLYPPTNSDYYAVVYAHDADNIAVRDLTVDGAANGNGYQEFLGVAFINAGGTLNGCRVLSITNNPPYNSNYGLGLYALAQSGVARTVTVSNSFFKDFQKSALLFYGTNLTVNVDGNIIEGAGTIAPLAQNGIQMSYNAKGVINNNTISKIAYKGLESLTASGILIEDAGSGISITNNTFTNCQLSVYFINSAAGKIIGNKITNSPGVLAGTFYYWGIVLRNASAEVAYNEIDGGGSGLGIDANTFGPGKISDMNAHNNLLKNLEFGITVERDGDTTGSRVYAKINCNGIIITQYVLYNDQPFIIEAPCNWLGTVNEADIIAAIDGLVMFKPYLLSGIDLLPLQTGFQPGNSLVSCNCSNLKLTLKSKKDVNCYGSDDGTVTLTVTGGTAPYQYKLDADEFVAVSGTEFTITDLDAGTHTVIVKDNAGNADAVTFVITSPSTPLDAQLTSKVDVKCNAAATGSAVISAIGGTAPYSIVNRPNSSFTTSITISNLTADDYQFVVRDAKGCEDIVEVSLVEPPAIDVDASTPTPACNGNNGSVIITASGGTAPYSIVNRPNSSFTNTITINGLAPGNNTFVVKDAAGCQSSITVTISGTGAGTFNPLPETFPNQFNTSFTRSLSNRTFVGSSGTWTVNSDENATMVVTTPYYSPSSSYALKVVNFKTTGCDAGWTKAISPKLNLTGPCCPAEVKLNFTLWSYAVVSGDTKARLEIDFSSDGGTNWTEVWSRTSAQLFAAYGANGKTMIAIPIPVGYLNANFRYRIRGEMEGGDNCNFYVFLDDIYVSSPSVCTPVGSIGNYVWNDKNMNGKQDSGEPGIANATVKLIYPNGTTATQITNSTGYYLFTNLPAGNYAVAFTTPSGYVPTLSNQGSNDAVDSDPVNGLVAVPLAAGQNNLTIDAGFYVPVCTNTTNHKETFPNKFNTYFYKSLNNATFTGSTGTWTTSSNSYATMAVTTPYYSPSTSYALKVVNFKTSGCGAGWTKAVSPKVDLSAPCCPSETKMTFTLWTYKVVCNDYKAKLEIDFSYNNGASWTEVWSKTSAQLYYYYGANGKTTISIPVPVGYQNANFRYRIRGEMASDDCNNFYVFLDDIKIGSPASCSEGSGYRTAASGDVKTTELPIATVIGELETKTATEKTELAALDMNVFPNPTASEFSLLLRSKTSGVATVRVMDMLGRVIKTMLVNTNQAVKFGAEFKNGNYVVEATLNDHKQVMKLLKL